MFGSLGNCQNVFQNGYTIFAFLPMVFENSNFSMSSPTLVTDTLITAILAGCEMISHCSADFYFCVLTGHSGFFSREISSLIIYSFLNVLFILLLLNFKSLLYILDMSPSSDLWLISIFFHSEDCLFTFLVLFFFKDSWNSFHNLRIPFIHPFH